MSECFLGVGMWRPDTPSLGKIRDRIVERETEWLKARDHRPLQKRYLFSGESLKTSPRGYFRDHPMIEDLRRKDFIAIHALDPELITSQK